MNEQERQKILCIEDEGDILDLLRIILERDGFECISALGGLEGLQKARSVQPDLILLDLMMPDMDGFAVLDELKADEALRDLPVIVITAKELTQKERQRLQGQIKMLLQKGSFMDDDLLEDINALLDRI